MKEFKLDEEHQENFDSVTKACMKLLISTMTHMEIPNYIKCKAICEGFEYNLKIVKTNAKD